VAYVTLTLNSEVVLVWRCSMLSLLFFFCCSRARRDLHSFPTRRSSDLKAARRLSGAGVNVHLVVPIAIGDTDAVGFGVLEEDAADRKSTRLNSSHLGISYAVFCLKKKNRIREHIY